MPVLYSTYLLNILLMNITEENVLAFFEEI